MSRAEAHAQKEILVKWIKVQGHHGVPLSLASVADYASDIVGKAIGKNWLDQFHTRHPELSLKNTIPLKESYACALTPATISGFYDILDNTVSEYYISPENIYNMDKKGIQLGIGACTAVLVDCN
ncbi:hypothetical protein HHX47_DHR7000370 [Lentinula edodes]|nr:hypothetical protein HHX47_DHR7000370 [Lentinula edodes]